MLENYYVIIVSKGEIGDLDAGKIILQMVSKHKIN